MFSSCPSSIFITSIVLLDRRLSFTCLLLWDVLVCWRGTRWRRCWGMVSLLPSITFVLTRGLYCLLLKLCKRWIIANWIVNKVFMLMLFGEVFISSRRRSFSFQAILLRTLLYLIWFIIFGSMLIIFVFYTLGSHSFDKSSQKV